MGAKHITSDAIVRAGTTIENDVKPKLLAIKTEVDQTSVPFPGFGIVGLGFASALDSTQEYARNYCQSGADKLHDLHNRLNTVAAAWVKVENANTIKVVP